MLLNLVSDGLLILDVDRVSDEGARDSLGSGRTRSSAVSCPVSVATTTLSGSIIRTLALAMCCLTGTAPLLPICSHGTRRKLHTGSGRLDGWHLPALTCPDRLSNLIQVVRSKTWDGFVPNYSSGGRKSRDRSEPQVISKVLLEIFQRHQERWIVELLFDDLLEWNTWTWNHRRLQKSIALIALGSDPNEPVGGDISFNDIQGARYESGLDNSPMYDDAIFDNKTHLMQM